MYFYNKFYKFIVKTKNYIYNKQDQCTKENIMYKLVAIDLDGTLLNSYGEVSEENKQAIEKAVKKGAIVVLASR